MRLISIMFLLSLFLNSADLNTCKGCHPIIYSEFQNSMHKKSSIKDDKIHKAIWDRHPAKAKNNYICAKCHAPNGSHEGITCLSCHTITKIEHHKKSNSNIYEKRDKLLYSAQKGMEDKKIIYKEESSWFGLITKSIGSPYHDIDYTHQEYYTGEVCMGCHSHKQNSHGFTLCKTEKKGVNKKENCITCHMPKIEGSATTIRESKTHAFHGFAGVINNPKILSKYIDIDLQKTDNGFNIIITNKAPHKLLTHPLRVVELHTKLKRDNKEEELKKHNFIRIIGKNKKPSMPWLATEVIKDNMIKANEKRVISFDKKLQKGDEIETTLGFFIVNPKAIDKLGLKDDKELSSFIPLKSRYFLIK
jgi:hypothetical protein